MKLDAAAVRALNLLPSPTEGIYEIIILPNLLCFSICYVLLKRSLGSVVRISLYYQLQTTADSERIYRSS